MKKLLLVVLSVLLVNNAFADDAATLRVKITTPTKHDNSYFVCLPGGVGCVNMAASNSKKGEVLPMSTGAVDKIFTADVANMEMYTQPLPASCHVTVSKDQTLTVSGKLVVRKNPAHANQSVAYIKDLHCAIV